MYGLHHFIQESFIFSFGTAKNLLKMQNSLTLKQLHFCRWHTNLSPKNKNPS